MGLRDEDGLDAVARPGFQPDGPVDPAGGESRTPIPAERALFLPQKGAAANGIVPFSEVRRLLVRADVFQRTGEGNFQRVFSRTYGLRDRETVAKKHVVRAGDGASIQRDGGEGVEAFGQEIEMFVAGGGGLEFAPIRPVAFLNPLKVFFVRPPEGIGNQFVPEEVGVDAAGNVRGQPEAGTRIEKSPVFGEWGDVFHFVSESYRAKAAMTALAGVRLFNARRRRDSSSNRQGEVAQKIHPVWNLTGLG